MLVLRMGAGDYAVGAYEFDGQQALAVFPAKVAGKTGDGALFADYPVSDALLVMTFASPASVDIVVRHLLRVFGGGPLGGSGEAVAPQVPPAIREDQ